MTQHTAEKHRIATTRESTGLRGEGALVSFCGWVPSKICRMIISLGVLSGRLAIGSRRSTKGMASGRNDMLGMIPLATSYADGAAWVRERIRPEGPALSAEDLEIVEPCRY